MDKRAANQLDNQLLWYKDRGLDNISLLKNRAEQLPIKCLFLQSENQVVSFEYDKLFLKMKTAMNLKSDEYYVCTTNRLNNYFKPKAIILFGKQALNELNQNPDEVQYGFTTSLENLYPGVPTLLTYSIEELVSFPHFKRDTWQHLQMVLRRI